LGTVSGRSERTVISYNLAAKFKQDSNGHQGGGKERTLCIRKPSANGVSRAESPDPDNEALSEVINKQRAISKYPLRMCHVCVGVDGRVPTIAGKFIGLIPLINKF